jgi:hypothetical protein
VSELTDAVLRMVNNMEGIEAGDNIEAAREEWVYAVRTRPECLHTLRIVDGYDATDLLRNMRSNYEDPDFIGFYSRPVTYRL